MLSIYRLFNIDFRIPPDDVLTKQKQTPFVVERSRIQLTLINVTENFDMNNIHSCILSGHGHL